MPRRIGRGCPEGVDTDYLTDNQLYERVGQADAVYIERKPPDHLGLISTRGCRKNRLKKDYVPNERRTVTAARLETERDF